MPRQTPDTDAQIADFLRRNGRHGRLERYAIGRVRHFALRQVMTIVGSLALALLISPWLGLLTLVLALAGEAVDCLLLRRVPELLKRPGKRMRIAFWTSVTAGIQAATIVACVAATLVFSGGPEVHFFALSFLAGAAINAGLVYTYHRDAALVRLTIYSVAAAVIIGTDMMLRRDQPSGGAFNLLGALVMSGMVFLLLRGHILYDLRQRRDRIALLRGKRAVQKANLRLRQGERELRRLSMVARYANDSVIISDIDSRILWVNAAFTNLTGYSLDEARGRTPTQLLNGPETSAAVTEQIRTAMKAGQTCRAEILNYTRDGEKIWVETNLVPVKNAEGEIEVIVAVERNVTDAKRQAAELAQAKIAAEEGARAKAAFLANMSHEIRTPMNGILGMVELLEDEDLGEEGRLCTRTIRQSGEALLRIIDDILDFSRLDADKLTLEEAPFSLANCVRGALDVLRPLARDKGLFLDLSVETRLPPKVLGDSGRLRQILINLVGNAVKFTDHGGVTIAVSAQASGEGHQIRMTFDDTGIGIPRERAAQVFGQFEQADTETTRKFGGTGLGLAISRQLARRMGGDLSLVDRPGPGTRFRLDLWLEDGSDAVDDCAAPAAPISRLPKGLKVLVAEDNDTNRLLLRKFLADQSIVLFEARDGRDAVAQAADHLPDVILMDLSMPIMDGLDATRAIRRAPGPQPRIIALTANVFDADRVACTEAGMDAFLSKPLRKPDLLRALAETDAPRLSA